MVFVIFNSAFLNGRQAPSVVDQLLEMTYKPPKTVEYSAIKQKEATN